MYAIAELNAAIKGVFSRSFQDIWVTGEISGYKAAGSGHCYFALKDNSGQVRCVLFKGTARWLKFRPQDGMSVLARGSLDIYEQRGEYQLIVEQLEPQGAGALQLAFEQLKKKLEAEGLFAAESKRALPKLPRRLGIVTSATGAVIRDILHVLERRFRGLHIRIFHTLVQGEGAAEQVCRALSHFSEDGWAEVVIVARGGGSIEDLWTFNEEDVARAIRACAIPVISAIGHETDFTIADFVADLRAPTPSAAAELVICTRDSLLDLIRTSQERVLRSARYQLLTYCRLLQERGLERAEALMHRSINKRAQQVDDLEFRLRSVPRQLIAAQAKRLAALDCRLQALDSRVQISQARSRLEIADSHLIQRSCSMLWKHKQRLTSLQAQLAQLSPLAVLGRGYALVKRNNGTLVRSVEQTAEGDSLMVQLSDGQLETRVGKLVREQQSTN